MPKAVRCHSRRLCYYIEKRKEVEMLNLETGERSIWAASGAESLRHLSLSNRYLVLVWGET